MFYINANSFNKTKTETNVIYLFSYYVVGIILFSNNFIQINNKMKAFVIAALREQAQPLLLTTHLWDLLLHGLGLSMCRLSLMKTLVASGYSLCTLL